MDNTEDITDMNSDDILDSEIEELKEELDVLFKKRSKSKKKLKRLIKRFKKADRGLGYVFSSEQSRHGTNPRYGHSTRNRSRQAI